MSANNTFVRNSTTGETYDNLFPDLTLTGTLKLTALSTKTTETEVLHINPSTGIVVRGTAATSTESGFSYVNTTTSSILSIPATAVIVPIHYAVSPTITRAFNWSSADWTLGTGTQNRFIYSGAPKKFEFHVDMQISSASAAATVYCALYKNGSALARSAIGQTQGVFGAINPTFECTSFVFPFTAVSSDFFELFIYGSSTGLSITPFSATGFTPASLVPSITIECHEIKI